MGLLCGAMMVGLAGCGKNAVRPPRAEPPTPRVPAEVRVDYQEALEAMAARDLEGRWDDEACESVARSFLEVSAAHESSGRGKLATALYNAGLAYQRCGRHGDARERLREALIADPSLYRAEVQLALHAYREQGNRVLDDTIRRVRASVIEAKFRDPDTMVHLAMLQMRRGGPHPQAGCEDDLECAKLNLQRALAIDDGYMPAFNQLALLYLAKARVRAGIAAKEVRSLRAADQDEREVSVQMLDLAALVCSQAIRRNGKYAPIFNTLGLIRVELGDTNGAAESFGTARRLDPRFFEAHMNHAALNLSFRGFGRAERAYRDALRVAPRDYEARLGLALALRGQMDASNIREELPKVRAQLARAKKTDRGRPESYFNEGILIQEFEAKLAPTPEDKVQAYQRAIEVFDVFLARAGDVPRYRRAVRMAKERVGDMRKMICFFSDQCET